MRNLRQKLYIYIKNWYHYNTQEYGKFYGSWTDPSLQRVGRRVWFGLGQPGFAIRIRCLCFSSIGQPQENSVRHGTRVGYQKVVVVIRQRVRVNFHVREIRLTGGDCFLVLRRAGLQRRGRKLRSRWTRVFFDTRNSFVGFG